MRTFTYRHYTVTFFLTGLLTYAFAQNVGVETIAPDSTLSIKNKVEIGGAQGDIVFTDDEGSITFPATTAPNSAMMHMFSSGSTNADRMVIAHSPLFSNWGLQYRDVTDEFHFLGGGNHVFSLALSGGRAAIGTAASLNSLFTLNVQTSTEDRTGYFFNNKASTNTTYGIYAGAFGTGSGDKRGGSFDANGGSGVNIAVRGTASGSSTENIAIYGTASGTNPKAAWFDAGNVIVDDRIGIGTDAPNSTTKLHVLDGDIRLEGPNEFFDIRNTTTTNVCGIRFYDGTTFQGGIFHDSGEDRINITGSNLVATLVADFATNSVAIGTLTPAAGYKLSVDGKITGEELRIRNSVNWPDYVFSEQYELMPLDELEQSIHINGHLPGVPSASSVEENGIMVGEMHKITMEKVEELTLYLIEVNKENQALRLELQELKNEVEELRKK